MLILDVRTRWTSTHQMLREFLPDLMVLASLLTYRYSGRALDHRNCLDDWVDRQREVRPLELKPSDWDALSLLEDWLQAFRDATTSMSATRFPMLSTVHATFRGLQDHIKRILRSLPDSVSPRMKQALTDAHMKLAEYYEKFDQSPFYTWAACKSLINRLVPLLIFIPLVLDPRIGYKGVVADYEDDPTLKVYLEKCKQDLETHFNEEYKHQTSVPSREGSSASILSTNSTAKYDFTSRYKQRERPPIDELQEFWKLEPEDFDTCDPIDWWFNHRLQFPHLYQLALDVLSIPGQFLVVIMFSSFLMC